MVVADLHVHTRQSDGRLTVERLPEAAREAGVEVVAVTDHDRLHPDLDAPVTERDGLTIVHGIELRVDAGEQRVDLLGYGVEPTEDLRAACDRIQRNRIERGRAIIDCVEDRLETSLDIEPRPGLGRPHIARAVADATDRDPQWAFDELIGDDCPCYVPREIPSFERGRDLLTDSCSLVGLAHPFRYDDPERALALCDSLSAVERYYPYGHAVDEEALSRAIDAHDLAATGGSDAHGDSLGHTGLDRPAFDRIRSALGV